MRWDVSYTTVDTTGSHPSTIYHTSYIRLGLDLAAGLGWQFTRAIGVEARFVHSPYKASALNNPTATTRVDVNRDWDVLQLAATFRW